MRIATEPVAGDEKNAVFTRCSVCTCDIWPPNHHRHLSLTS